MLGQYYSILIVPLFLLVISANGSYKENSNGLQKELSGKCECEGYNCGCCEHIKVAVMHVDNTVCSNVTYLPDDYGVSLTVTFDSFTVFNETVSARNPPPYCIGQPFIKQLMAEVCVRLYEMDVGKRYLHGCVKIEAILYTRVVSEYDVGCFDIGHKSAKDSSNTGKKLKTILGRIGMLNQPPMVNMI